MNLLRQAEAEEAAGRLWRAKELLRNAIHSLDPDLFERYGRVLLQMRDTKEAGRWLFLSGRRLPEYREAIATYLEWHGERGPRKLYGSFPRCARLPEVEGYPPALAEELLALGFPREIPDAWGHGPEQPNAWWDRLTLAGCATSLIVLLVVLIAGLVAILRVILDNI